LRHVGYCRRLEFVGGWEAKPAMLLALECFASMCFCMAAAAERHFKVGLFSPGGEPTAAVEHKVLADGAEDGLSQKLSWLIGRIPCWEESGGSVSSRERCYPSLSFIFRISVSQTFVISCGAFPANCRQNKCDNNRQEGRRASAIHRSYVRKMN
jgi:hypothetical protein